jgi:hypothetical protein
MKHFASNLQTMVSWLSHLRPTMWFLGLFIVLVAVYAAMIPLPRADNHLIGSDGGYYYSYMRSFWMDHDVDIRNDVELYNSRMRPDNPNRIRVLYDRSVGPALLWTPFFLVARGLTILLSNLGIPIATDGFSYLEEAMVCVGSILYAVLGLYALFVTLSRYVTRIVSASSVFLMFLSTFAFYYTLFEPSMGHALELFTVSIFVWSILEREPDTNFDWLLVGGAAGLMSLVRWQNCVFMLLIPYGLIRTNKQFARMATRGAMAAVAFLAMGTIQSLFWVTVFGKILTIPQGESFMTPLHTHFLSVLFSTRHGLISWHPIFALAALGMFFIRPKWMGIVMTLAVLIQLYVCSSVDEWWCADSFGMRRMTGTIPMLTFGVAFLLNGATVPGKSKRLLATCVCVALVAWNFIFMAQYRLGMIPPGEELTLSQMTTGKLQVFTKGYECFRKIKDPSPVEPIQ